MIRTLTFALMMGLGATQAFANDTTALLKTGGLEFVKTFEISMEEEKLYISPKEVRVDYIYRNTSEKPVTTYVAFPMPDIEGQMDAMVDAGNTASDNFLGFSVVQDGVEIKPSLQQSVYAAAIDMTDIVKAAKVPLNPLGDATRAALKALPQDTLDDWLTRGLITQDIFADEGAVKAYIPLWTLKSAYWWKTTFPVGKDTHVSHKYRTSVGGTVAITYLDEGKPKGQYYEEYRKKYCVDDAFVKVSQKLLEDAAEGKPYYFENWISYILTTGNNWMGPIKKFTLTVDKGEPDNYVSFCGTGVKKTGDTTFQMTATDFSPERELDILLLVPSGAP
ncbi:MAG: hypothetical protein JWM58_3691 [Rhizobium sp.]|nr:hypothetical protein [Rhizobium sp.]